MVKAVKAVQDKPALKKTFTEQARDSIPAAVVAGGATVFFKFLFLATAQRIGGEEIGYAPLFAAAVAFCANMAYEAYKEPPEGSAPNSPSR